MSQALRQSHRNRFQRFVSDPIIGCIVWIFISLLQILPINFSSALGGCLGHFFYYLFPKRNRIGRKNLEIAFPNKTASERETILKKMWIHWGRVYGELPHASKLFQRANKIGINYLHELAQKKQGCFVCSGHLGNFEISAATYLFDDYCLNPVYRAANNPWLDKILFQRRKGVLIPKGTQGAKKMLSVLKSGKAVVILCDQKLREGLSVPFFGKPAMTASAVAGLSQKMNIPILMAMCLRRADGNFDITVYPLDMPKNTTNNDFVYETVLRINQELEKWIKKYPEQWLWIHRRFDKSEYN